jgi:hypothetical protein
LRRLNFSAITELPLLSGRRTDIVALSMDATIIIVEIKSSVADFRAGGNTAPLRQILLCLPASMPVDIIPEDAGLILADAYAARHAHALCTYRGTTPASLERFRRPPLGADDALFGLIEFSSDKNKLVISIY